MVRAVEERGGIIIGGAAQASDLFFSDIPVVLTASRMAQSPVDAPVAVTVIDIGEGPRALPAVEIRPRAGVYDYTARYTAGETRFIAPANITDENAEACAAMGLAVHAELGLRDLSRTDIIIDADGPVFIETNVAPGMTETSLVPLAVEAAELDFGELCAALVRQAHVRGGGTSQG